jgi:hypothetical protein
MLAVVMLPAVVEAGGRAEVYLTQAKLNLHELPTEAKLLGFARKHKTKILQETTIETDVEKRKFPLALVVKFAQAPNDYQFEVTYYDLEEGRRWLRTDTTMVTDPKQRTYVDKNVKLDRPKFQPNHRMEVVVVVRKQEVGSFKFETRGERKRHSGVVSFDE